jgi:transmembrane sensor
MQDCISTESLRRIKVLGDRGATWYFSKDRRKSDRESIENYAGAIKRLPPRVVDLMEPELNDIDDLIGKVLSGEATPDEIRYVDSWRKASRDNARYYDDLKLIFSKAASNQVKIDFDADEAWKKVQSKLVKTKTINWQPLRIAAGIVLVVVAGIFAYRSFNKSPQTMAIVSDNKVVRDTLPDGSTAVLNKRSSIEFEYNPREKTRKVKLKGEGFFEVKHEESKPFVIQADEALVRDIGTAFNIRSYPDKDSVEVVVQSGVVQFYTLNDPGMMLMAGETGYYSKSTKTFSKLTKADTNVLAYKTRVFAFHATDLRSAIEQINEVYDSKIKLANDIIANCQVTVTFRNNELDEIVDILAETMNLTIERTDQNEIILNGQKCQ